MRAAPERFLRCALLVLVGCATPLRQEMRGISDKIHQARTLSAYVCAPEALAKAESHVEFARLELRAGEYLDARAEVRTADSAADEALQKSRAGCALNEKKGPADSDNDGIADPVDECPRLPEDVDGFADEDGCPDDDNDKDHIADADDKCPNEPEDRDGFEDEDGCPEPDNDGDGLPDTADRCPNVPGPIDTRGCPAPKLIVVTDKKIELKQKVRFATNRSEILPVSFAMLNEISVLLVDSPRIHVRIEGHTDARGPAKKNRTLSHARAAAVKAYLVARGVDGERLTPEGFGAGQPIADNRTAIGREQNRRVEFIITAQ